MSGIVEDLQQNAAKSTTHASASGLGISNRPARAGDSGEVKEKHEKQAR